MIPVLEWLSVCLCVPLFTHPTSPVFINQYLSNVYYTFGAFKISHVFIFVCCHTFLIWFPNVPFLKHYKKLFCNFFLPAENKAKLFGLICMAFLNKAPTYILRFIGYYFTYLPFHSNLTDSPFSAHLHFIDMFSLLKLFSCYTLAYTSKFLTYFKTHLSFHFLMQFYFTPIRNNLSSLWGTVHCLWLVSFLNYLLLWPE